MSEFLKAAAAAALLFAATPAAAQSSEWRTVDPQNLLVIETTKGPVLVEIAAFAAPGHAERIKTLTRQGFYDGVVFHRVIDDFMAQTGDPTGTGTGGSTLPDVTAEFTFKRGLDTPVAVVRPVAGGEEGLIGSFPVSGQSDMAAMVMAGGKVNAWGMFCPGVAGMARNGSDENSANSQFFLMRGRMPTQERAAMDKKYTPWGRVVSGLNVVQSLAEGEPPTNPDRMTRVRLAADLPEAERPVVRVMDTRGAAFKAEVAKARAAGGADFSACDIDVPVQVSVPATR